MYRMANQGWAVETGGILTAQVNTPEVVNTGWLVVNWGFWRSFEKWGCRFGFHFGGIHQNVIVDLSVPTKSTHQIR